MGDTSPNQVYGGNGDDEVTGDLAADLLDGGPGLDRGYGGRPGLKGADVFLSVERRTSCPSASWTPGPHSRVVPAATPCECLTDHFVFRVRTASRKEIDFVSEHLGGVALEGKYTEGAWRSEAATVSASTWDGILATRNVLETEGKDSAWAVPACLLAYLLDA